MESALAIEVLSIDVGVELRVASANDRFSASVDLWAGPDVLVDLAEQFRGFPSTSDDVRAITLGYSESDGPGVQLELTVDGTTPRLSVEAHSGSDVARFVVPLEALAVDCFVAALEQLTPDVGATARLDGSV